MNRSPDPNQTNYTPPQWAAPSPTPAPVAPTSPSAPTPPRPSLPTRVYRTRDAIFAWLSLLAGMALVHMLPLSQTPLGAMLALIALFVIGFVYLRVGGVRVHGRAITCAILGVILSLSMITNGNNTLRGWTFFFLLLGFFAWIYDACGLAGRKPKDSSLLPHILAAIFKHPFRLCVSFFASLGSMSGKKGKSKRFWMAILLVLIGLGVALIPTLIIGLLLSYDKQFTDLLDRIFSFGNIFDFIGDLFVDTFFGLPLAMLVFSALFCGREKNESGKEETPPSFEGAHCLPSLILYASVTPILILYVIFFVSQWSYYVSAFTHILPENLTYAEYAREGFFQLCTVCGINAAILALFNLLIKRRDGDRVTVVARVYNALISLFTLVLIATALSKMILYIDSYGLTPKRVYASWFIIVLAFAFIVVLIRQLVRKLPATAITLAGAFVLFAIIAIPNVDATIARYNVDAYLSGELETVDLETLGDLDISAVPALVDLEEALKETADRTEAQEETLKAASELLNAHAKTFAENKSGFFSFSIPEYRARDLLKSRIDYIKATESES